MRLRTIITLIIFGTFFAFSCDSGGGAVSTGDPGTIEANTTSVEVKVGFQTVSGSVMMNALGTADEIVSINVEAINASSGNSYGVSSLTNEGQNWVGVLTELPYDTSIKFVASAVNSASSAIFSGSQTQTLVAGQANEISITLSSIDDGEQPVNPEIVSAALPEKALVNSDPLPISFTISYAASVNYNISVIGGRIAMTEDGTPVSQLSGTHVPSSALSLYFFAPASAGVTTITLTVTSTTGSDDVGASFQVAVIDYDPETWTDTDIVVVVGPAITGMEFFRSSTTLKATVTTDPETGLAYSWSGTGSFSSIADTGNPLFIENFTDDMAGEISVTVTDQNNVQAFLSRTIEAGDFPYEVADYIADMPGLYIYDDTTGLMWQDNTNRIKRKWMDAGQYCADLSIAGYAEWRLPTTSELQNMFNRRNDFSLYYAEYYWTSDEDGDRDAYKVSFANGTEAVESKTRRNLVRCVR